MNLQFAQQCGDQRRIHIQLTKNKRRLKRRRKKLKKSKISVEKRAAYVLEYGKICSYTHPKDVDPFWDILYRQYEYLIYMDISYRMYISQSNKVFSNKELLSIADDLAYIHHHKQILLTYMMNFMNIMYGSVIQSRFYGWKAYIEEFVSKFNEVAITSLKKLKFDVNQTRCSVYFYQAFWLSGLSIINKISEKLKKHYNDDSLLNRGNSVFSQADVDFDTIYEEHGSLAIDALCTIKTEEDKESGIDIIVDDNKEKCIEELSDVQIDNSDYEIFCTLKKLLHQINIDITHIYTLSDKRISKIGKLIRKKINAGEIVLQTKDKQLLTAFFSSPILRK